MKKLSHVTSPCILLFFVNAVVVSALAQQSPQSEVSPAAKPAAKLVASSGSSGESAVSTDSAAPSEYPTTASTPSPNPGLKREPGAYVIGEQDVLNINVWKEPDLSGTTVVRPDGKITLPLVNDIQVVGLTTKELQELLTEKLKPFLTVPQVTVSPREINSRKVYVIGQVGHEGAFGINGATTVLQMIAQVGGLRDFAKRKKIYVMRTENGKQTRYPFNYDDVIQGKRMNQNILLQPGDTVVVP